MILSGKCRVYRDLGVYPDILMHHLVKPGFLLVLATPPTLFYQLYLRKRYKKTNHPRKNNLNHSGNFSTNPTPGISAPTRRWSFPHLEEVAHEEHGGKTLHRNQATTSNVGPKTNIFFAPQKMGKKTPFLKMMVKDLCGSFGISGFNGTFKGTLSCVQPLGFSMFFLLRLATNDEKYLETRPTVLRKMFGAGKPVKAGYKWALNAGVSTQTHATRFLRKGKQELKPRWLIETGTKTSDFSSSANSFKRKKA